jgi:hypothetical protein
MHGHPMGWFYLAMAICTAVIVVWYVIAMMRLQRRARGKGAFMFEISLSGPRDQVARELLQIGQAARNAIYAVNDAAAADEQVSIRMSSSEPLSLDVSKG